jgi:hypothetical protein
MVVPKAIRKPMTATYHILSKPLEGIAEASRWIIDTAALLINFDCLCAPP